jgi:uncharacterized protein (TIGR02600 family)
VTITDGPLINKTDEGSLFTLNGDNNPYFQDVSYAANQATEVAYGEFFHSANRQMPSAVMFGSLPTGLISGQPWQTLLFRPTPLAHPGKTDPPDRLLLDLFWMPVVEPYAISEPFSTAGKINMKFQMIPFTYIERSTALQAVLMNERILAVPDTSWAGALVYDRRSPPNFEFSLPLNVEETLTPFHDKFQDGDVFLSATEITDLYLVPDSASATYAGMESFWNANRMTGDNLRERPYAHIYPRLTTKSNVFKVHYRVESLRKRPNSDPTIWDETRDKVVASSRGNTLIERFIDLNQSGIRDFATDATANAETLYRFRILSTKEFTP